jgi:hypothetical protein
MSFSRLTLAVLLIWATGAQAPYAQDHSFEIPAVDSKTPALEIGGNIDVNYSLLLNRTDSALFQLTNVGQSVSSVSASYPLDLYLNGDYQAGALGVHLKTQVDYAADNTFDFALNEVYGSVKLSDSALLRLGKTIYNWGKGYAFNVVGFVNPVKDPENLDYYLGQGLFSVNLEYSKSLQSNVLKNLSLDFIAIPPVILSPSGASDILDTNLAAKLYLLLWDTDIDLMGYLNRTGVWSVGMDFSRNIVPSLELHGEIAYSFGQPKNIISEGGLSSTSVNGLSYLAGLRWLNSWNITTILEYYHNDAGLTSTEFMEYIDFLQMAVDSGSSARVSQALSIRKSAFSGPDLMQDYAYLKLSWPEPFHLVDFTAAAFAIYSIDDNSALVALSFSYDPITNLEFVLTPTLLIGGPQTLYGAKPYEFSVSVLARYYF